MSHVSLSSRVCGSLAGLALLTAGGCGADNPGETAGVSSTGGGGTEAATTDGPTTDGPTTTADASTGDAPPTGMVTWHQDLAPVIVSKCGGCHMDGGIAPFSLQTYEESKPFAATLLDSVERKVMPPFLAETTELCAPIHDFKDDPRLTAGELDLLRAWVDQGAPEGEAATAKPIPPAADLVLKDTDISLKIPSEVTVAGSEDQYLCFSIDTGFTEDTWLDGLQINAGNPRIVHHVLAYVDEKAESADKVGPNGEPYPCFGGPGIDSSGLIGVWAPGSVPFVPPKDVAMRVVAGARIVLSVHYHPTGVEERDATTSIDLSLAPGLPTYVGMLVLLGNVSSASEGLRPGPNDANGVPEFRIPAGVEDHTEEMLIDLDSADIPELRVFGVATHMHYVGTDMVVGIQHKNPEADETAAECLLQTPRWDFQWQRLYSYDADLDQVPRVRPGDSVYLKCTYNNSMSNAAVVKALGEEGLTEPKEVRLGEATLDEMCLGVFGVAVKLKDIL